MLHLASPDAIERYNAGLKAWLAVGFTEHDINDQEAALGPAYPALLAALTAMREAGAAGDVEAFRKAIGHAADGFFACAKALATLPPFGAAEN